MKNYKLHWTKEEIEALKKIAKKDLSHFQMSQIITTRTPIAIKCKKKELIKNGLV